MLWFLAPKRVQWLNAAALPEGESRGQEKHGGQRLRQILLGFGLALGLAFAPGAIAQPAGPRIGFVYPAGGQQNTSFHVTVGGQGLDGVTNAYVSGPGVEVKVVDYVKPLTQAQVNEYREKLKEMQDQRAAAMRAGNRRGRSGEATSPAQTNKVWTAADEKLVAEIRQKLSTFQRRQTNPALAERVMLEVAFARDAESGPREIRLLTRQGLSNPLVFCVDAYPEFFEKETAAEAALNRGREGRGNLASAAPPAEVETRVRLPGILNGQILPGDVDRFRFAGRKGQSLVVATRARELIPYLADAVPGWFQAVLKLSDAQGNEVAYNDDYRFHPDPVLQYEIPKDGDYVLEIKDAIYRGREDFVYRLTIGELPFVTGVFPLGGPVGAPTPVAAHGWNLPVKQLTPETDAASPSVRFLSVRKDTHTSNLVPFAIDTLPESTEQEPNNTPGKAQTLGLPVIVNGRVDSPGDWDIYRFEGRAGDEIVAEVTARRLGSPLDSLLRLTDGTGRQLAFNDDHEDKGTGLNTHHADSWLRAILPEDGTYWLHLGDTQRQGGPEYAYRLRLSPPRPDFELRVVPSSVNLRGGMCVPLTVYALRKDGMTNEITLRLKDAPAGFALSGGRVPARQDQVRITLTAPPTAPPEPVSLLLEGRATLPAGQIRRDAVPAEDMMQAFAYRHLVPMRELKVAVGGRGGFRTPAIRILGSTPVRIPAGGTARLPVAAGRGAFLSGVQLELSDPPDGISIKSVTSVSEGAEIVLESDASKVKPGLAGNLIVAAFSNRTPPAAAGKTRPNRRQVTLGVLPAIPFEVVP